MARTQFDNDRPRIFVHEISGLRVYYRKFGSACDPLSAEFSLPRLYYGDNFHLFPTEVELREALDLAQNCLEQLLDFPPGWNIRHAHVEKVDYTIQFQTDFRDLSQRLKNFPLRGFRKEPEPGDKGYGKGNLIWDHENRLRMTMYDKILEMRRGKGRRNNEFVRAMERDYADPNVVRFECRLSTRQAFENFFGEVLNLPRETPPTVNNMLHIPRAMAMLQYVFSLFRENIHPRPQGGPRTPYQAMLEALIYANQSGVICPNGLLPSEDAVQRCRPDGCDTDADKNVRRRLRADLRETRLTMIGPMLNLARWIPSEDQLAAARGDLRRVIPADGCPGLLVGTGDPGNGFRPCDFDHSEVDSFAGMREAQGR